MRKAGSRLFTLALILFALATPDAWRELEAEEAVSTHAPTRVAIIIDDMGDHRHEDERALALPGPIAYAFLPHTPHARRLAGLARQLDKEVMLHLPMESSDGHATGAGAITLDMTEEELVRTLDADLAAVPHVIGINNHMGSLLTQHPGHMRWLMRALRQRGGLFFLDSRTIDTTVAQRVAQETGLPNLRRDVFLDNDRSPAAIAREFNRLLALARKKGVALAIGHPHPETLSFLEEHLPGLEQWNVELVPVSSLIQQTAQPPRVIQVKTYPARTADPPRFFHQPPARETPSSLP